MFMGHKMAKAFPTEEEMQERLTAGEKMRIEDLHYVSTIEKIVEVFWAESWPVPGVNLDPIAYECRTLAEALAWVIGKENITWE